MSSCRGHEHGGLAAEGLTMTRVLVMVAGVVLIAASEEAFAQCEYRRHQCMFTDGFDYWGWDLKVVGDVAMVGAPGSEEVYVLAFDGNEWHQQQVLTDATGEGNTEFGKTLDIGLDIAVIGSPGDSSTGSALVYVLEDGVWIERQKITPKGGLGDCWGSPVAISGDGERIVVGSAWSGNYDGVHVYRHVDEEWVHEALLTPADTDLAGDVDISDDGTRIVMGAVFGGQGSLTGIAYAYEYDGEEWVKKSTLEPDDLQKGDAFGAGVDFAGDDSALIWGGGKLYVFATDSDGTWMQTDKLVPDKGVSFGEVGTDGDHMAVTANGNEESAVFVFAKDGTKWIHQETIEIEMDEYYAASVSLSGGMVMAGALSELLIHSFQCTDVPCDGDANGDGIVDPLDTGYVLARFGCHVGICDVGCDIADQNGDGLVDPLDAGFVLARFGECP